MKFKTVREGEQAVILNHLGQGRLVVGPERVFLFRERFHRLRTHTANRYEYIEIHENNGSICHKPGPCQVFNNPLEFSGCVSQAAQCLDANHLLVVYKRLKGGETERRIIQGPAVFSPEAEEWVHEFQWHGADASRGHTVPGLNRFSQLPTIPGSFYYNVKEVRTNDDTMVTVKVMLFYKMDDVLKMLDTTHDPIADLINALCADVISFVGPLTYEQFIEKTGHLSNLETYPQLQQRAQRIGFIVEKVVFTGYHASDQLQEMQNAAIESRTQLRLHRDIEDQEQKLVNFKLKKEQERSSIEQAMAVKRQMYRQKIAETKQKHTLEMEELKLKQKLELSSKEAEVDLENKEAEDQHIFDHLSDLAKTSLDLTSYLTLQYNKLAHEEIRVSAPGGKEERPQTIERKDARQLDIVARQTVSRIDTQQSLRTGDYEAAPRAKWT